MRIGIFTDTYPPYINGVSTSIVMLQRALEKKGHEVFVVAPNPEGMTYKFENNQKIIKVPGIPTGIYDYRLTGLYPLKAINIIKEWDLDLIHSHTEFGVGTFARIMAKKLDIPLVHTYHTMYEDYVHYITKGYFTNSGKKVVEYLTKFYCDKTATSLVVPTKKTRDLFIEKYKIEKDIFIVPTGIEVEKFYKENFSKQEISSLRQDLKIEKDDFVILFVGRMAKEKNIEFLIDSHKDLIKKHPKAKLVLIGDGPDLESYKKQIKQKKLENNILTLGKVPWDQVSKYYQIANVFVTASTTETQGLTVIEAMAASKPVIAIDDEAFREVVIVDANGYLFKNKKQYKKQISHVYNNIDKLDELAKQARITSEKHSSKYFADQILNVYKYALGNRKLKKEKKFKKVINKIKKGFKREK